MTRRFLLLLIVIFGLFFWGMITHEKGILILVIPLFVYLGVAILYSPKKPVIKAVRELNLQMVKQYQPVQVRLTLVNEGQSAEVLSVEDILTIPFECIVGETNKLISFNFGETFQYEYEVTCPRGKHAFRGVHIENSDHFGLFQKNLLIPIQNDFQTVPKAIRLKQVRILPHQTRGFSGPIPARQSGAGMTFWGVREFHIGDPLRQINWKVSSRHEDNFFTNEFEQERIADVGLILDARDATNIVIKDEALFEYSILAASALSEAFLADGHRVSLLTYGYGIQRVYPGYGKIQHERILKALSEAAPGSISALENFNYLPTRLFSAQSQLVVISPLGPRDYPAFVSLRRNGYEVMLVSPDPVSFESRAYRESQEINQATRLAHLERNLILRRLMRLGVQVVNWPVDVPLDRILHTFSNRQFLFRRNPKMVR